MVDSWLTENDTIVLLSTVGCAASGHMRAHRPLSKAGPPDTCTPHHCMKLRYTARNILHVN